MPIAPPRPDDMFADAQTPSERIARFEAYKSTLSDCIEKSQLAFASGETMFVKGQGIVRNDTPTSRVMELEAQVKNMTKGMDADATAQAMQALGQIQDLTKDWTNSNPLGSLGTTAYSGLTPYDLSPALLMLIPRSFHLRNSTGRIGGEGTAKEYRRITGISNSGSGGVANLSTFFSSASASTTFSGLSLNRPPKISYAADRHVVAYVEQGVSDEVVMQGQFAAQGYTDLRSLSHTAVTWSTMLGEERNLLIARGSGTGYTGSVAVASISVASVAGSVAIANGGASIPAGPVYVKLTNLTGPGQEGIVSNEASCSVAAGSGVQVTVLTAGQGAIAFNAYAASVSGSETFNVTSSTTSFYLSTFNGSSVSAPSVDATASTLAYDGLLAVQTDPTQTGYFKRLNAALSTSNPGVEFQTGLTALYNSVLADPEEILLTSAIRVELSDSIKSIGSPNGYRVNTTPSPDGTTLNSVVTALQNEATGSMVDLTVMPYMPAGCSVIRSKSLPMPDSGVSETTQVANVQDLMMLEWPVIQMSYDLSSYMYGSYLHYAPGWSGAITGIQ